MHQLHVRSRFAFFLLVMGAFLGAFIVSFEGAAQSNPAVPDVPLFIEVEENLLTLGPGGSVKLTVTVEGTESEEAVIHWTSFEQGTFSVIAGNEATWIAPEGPGDYMIRATAVAPGESAYIEIMIIVK